MRLLTGLAVAALSFSTYAQPYSDARWAIQGALVSGGSTSIGVARYSNCYEYGLTAAATFRSSGTRTFSPLIFAGWRKNLGEYTYFAYGLDLGTTVGKINGSTIKENVFVAPYISLEQMLTSHLMLVGFINPYAFQYVKSNYYGSTTTNSIFSTGGIGINYLF